MTRSNSATRSAERLAFSSAFLHLVGIGRGEMAADAEEVALDGLEQRILEVDRRGGAREPDDGVEFVDVAIGGDANVVLGDASAAEEGSGTRVAGFRVDLHATVVSRES